MKEISEQELLVFFNDTLEKCGTFLLKEDDETIEYNIYEDFDIGVHSFLHKESLQKLYETGLISLEKLNKSILLRDKVIELQNSNEWGIEHFRISEKWKKIMILSDKIKALN